VFSRAPMINIRSFFFFIIIIIILLTVSSDNFEVVGCITVVAARPGVEHLLVLCTDSFRRDQTDLRSVRSMLLALLVLHKQLYQ